MRIEGTGSATTLLYDDSVSDEAKKNRSKLTQEERRVMVQILKKDVRHVVVDLAGDWGAENCVRRGIDVFRNNKSDFWWMHRTNLSCWQWMAEACRAEGEHEKAAYFDDRHEKREDDLRKLIPYVSVIRKWKSGTLIIPSGLTPRSHIKRKKAKE
jgi:hypothetical protein